MVLPRKLADSSELAAWRLQRMDRQNSVSVACLNRLGRIEEKRLAKSTGRTMRVQLRIVAGSLRGRKLSCEVSESLRPAPQMVREALFSILGTGVPDRPFYDLFAGTGAVGMEAISRGAASVTLVERDTRQAGAIRKYLDQFKVADRAEVVRGDVYRWGEAWPGVMEPVNIFLGPPFADFQTKMDQLVRLVTDLQKKTVPGSVIILQTEGDVAEDAFPGKWDVRRYGRNKLRFWEHEHDRA
ncbi:MAG: SAM-dependent methyltransferase [Gemmatales bacterium]|nr:MAG: SAM-dependent methyltransferase [Gemmatales bacterium]